MRRSVASRFFLVNHSYQTSNQHMRGTHTFSTPDKATSHPNVQTITVISSSSATTTTKFIIIISCV